MSVVSARFRQARPATFVVHLGKTSVALLLGLPLMAADSALVTRASDGIALLRQVVTGISRAQPMHAAVVLAMALAAPWLALFWLASMQREAPADDAHATLRRSAVLASARYLSALCVSLAGLAYAVVTSAALIALAVALGRALGPFAPDDKRVLFGCAALGTASVWLHALTLIDLAHAALADGSARDARSALSGALRATTPQRVLLHAALLAATLLLNLAGLLLPRLWLGEHMHGLPMLALAQTLALLVTCVRGWWLAQLPHARD